MRQRARDVTALQNMSHLIMNSPNTFLKRENISHNTFVAEFIHAGVKWYFHAMLNRALPPAPIYLSVPHMSQLELVFFQRKISLS